MTALLKCADLTRDSFLKLVEDMTPPENDASVLRVWAEAPDGWTLDYWPSVTGKLRWCGAGHRPVSVVARDGLTRTWGGRIFAPSGELRWRVIEALGEHCCRTVFLGKVDWVTDQLSDRSEILRPLCCRTERCFLWGQQSPLSSPEWVELRIPHRFCYPLNASSHRVRATVELWCDAAGDPHFARLCDLEPYQETQ